MRNTGLHSDVAHTWNQVFTNLMSADLGDTEHENQLLRSHWLMGYDYDRRNWSGSKSVKARIDLASTRTSTSNC